MHAESHESIQEGAMRTGPRGLTFVWAALVLAGSILLPAGATPARGADTIKASGGDILITPVRHGSVMIQYGGKVFHIDPWSQGDYSELPKADVILITDIHGDRLIYG